MAKRIVQLYDKYKSTTKVYPLIVGECITPDAKDKIDDIIEDNIIANPTPAGGETTLAYLEIGGTKYAIPVPTTVIANPTLAGTEADLGSIQIGDTKYKIGGGKQLYQYEISFRNVDSQILFNINFILADNLTSINDFKDWLTTNNHTSTSNLFYISGGHFKGSVAYALYLDNTTIKIGYCTSGGYTITYGNLDSSATITKREL